jgi:hypothetical protein
MLTYNSPDGSTIISRPGSLYNPTLRIMDDTGKNLFFLPNAQNNSFNYLVESNDSAIICSDALTIAPWITNHSGLRMTKSYVLLGGSASDATMDNNISFNTEARSISLNSPNWISANQAIVAPDFYLSATQESISGDIGNLRAADTTLTNHLATETQNRIDADGVLAGQYSSLFNGLSTHTDLIGALQTKTAYLSTSASESHFSSNVVLDNLSSVYINRTSNYTTPLLYCNTAPLFVAKAMVSFYMSASGPQIMTGGSSAGSSITRDSTGVYFLTLPSATRQTLTTFTAAGITFYSCSAQINAGDSSLLNGWTVNTHGDAGNGVIAIFVRGGGSSPNLTDLPNFASNLRTFITVFAY